MTAQDREKMQRSASTSSFSIDYSGSADSFADDVDVDDDLASVCSSSIQSQTTPSSGSLEYASSRGSPHSRKQRELDEEEEMDEDESRKIRRLRLLLALILVSAATVVAFAIYRVTRKGEKDQFEAEYLSNAFKLLEAFETNLRLTIAATDNYALVLSTQAEAATDTWPFVTAPKFEIQAASSRSLAGAAMLAVLPMVTESNKTQWENYSVNNTAWITDGLNFKSVVTQHEKRDHSAHIGHGSRRALFYSTIDAKLQSGQMVSMEDIDRLLNDDGCSDNDTGCTNNHKNAGEQQNQNSIPSSSLSAGGIAQNISSTIFTVDRKEGSKTQDGNGSSSMENYFFPVWQNNPVRADIVNYNLLSHPSFGGDLKSAKETSRIVFGRVADVSNPSDPLNFLYHNLSMEDDGVHKMYDPNDEDEKDDMGRHLLRGRALASHSDEGAGATSVSEYTADGYGDPFSMAFFPLFNQIDEPRNLVSILTVVLYWRDYFFSALSPNAQPVLVILENTCGQIVSYRVDNKKVEVLGEGEGDHVDGSLLDFDLLTFKVDDIAYHDEDSSLTFSGVEMETERSCSYTVTVAPTVEMYEYYRTFRPTVYAIMIVATFLFATLVFVSYDTLVHTRQKKIAKKARATTAVVNSLFPANVRSRLFESTEDEQNNVMRRSATFLNQSPKQSDYKNSKGLDRSDLPIADLFPEATVLFADISGFTAWSSSREPAQVFTLLERIYGRFDAIAKRKKVFKVETIGDSYLAVTGVPDPQVDHAVIMARFAFSCLESMNRLTKSLETTLGPDTGNLRMRFGIHSGPVTAGVLRGEKSRFQLFGDTVNTASRMESTGLPNRIQCSEATADLLMAAGKQEWVFRREQRVHAKGKGQVKTYWVNPSSESTLSSSQHVESMLDRQAALSKRSGAMLKKIEKVDNSASIRTSQDEQIYRLIDWNVDLLLRLLKRLVNARRAKVPSGRSGRGFFLPTKQKALGNIVQEGNPIEYVKEAITMPPVSRKSLSMGDRTALPNEVLAQLHSYVSGIAFLYRDNPFHSFAHASHVTLSAQKLLSRIVAPSRIGSSTHSNTGLSLDSTRHMDGDDDTEDEATYAFGITADPLTHFAIIFSAMIHDLDHPGVPNGQLVAEKTEVAEQYDNRCVAEQNSIDQAWDMLMQPAYAELRGCIFTDQEEYERFRGLVVNAVIATDIFDPEMRQFRNNRWHKAFHTQGNNHNGGSKTSLDISVKSSSSTKSGLSTSASIEHRKDLADLKATIVIEHLIQASDVSHTMQHWHVFQKWNEDLFHEMYNAYQNKRATKDPSMGWYEGELWFFDNYVIPLAMKLKDCGVFGVSSYEYLNYAKENRREWEFKGKNLVEEWKKKFSQDSNDDATTNTQTCTTIDE